MRAYYWWGAVSLLHYRKLGALNVIDSISDPTTTTDGWLKFASIPELNGLTLCGFCRIQERQLRSRK